MAAPAFVRIAGGLGAGNSSPYPVSYSGATIGNLLVFCFSQARRESGTPATATYTTPSGWTYIADKYYQLPDLLRTNEVHWASTVAFATIATTSGDTVSLSHTGTDGSFAYGNIYEYEPAKVVGSESYYGLVSNPTAATTYAAGAVSSIIWNIASSNEVGSGTTFTTTNANSFTNDVDSANSLFKSKFMHRDGVSGTVNLPTVTDVSALEIYNWYPWVSLAVELAAVPVGWVRGHAWG